MNAKVPSMQELENAFQPAREVNSVDRFAGRKDSVKDSYYALLSQGTNIAIVGNRGIGKTSLAKQIQNIASGDNDLLDRLNLPSGQNLDFLTIYLACGNTIASHIDMLKRLLTARDCLAEWIYDIPRARSVVEKYAPKLNVGFAGVDFEKETGKEEESAVSHHEIDTVFQNVLSIILAEGVARDGILIVVDEFDQIRDPAGFASFLKSLATNVPKVKFCIVGVAQDIQQLMKEHESADRLFSGGIIYLPPMPDNDLEEIIKIAVKTINGYIEFDEHSIQKIIGLAQGHPYMVHLIGKHTLRQATEKKIRVINAELIDHVIEQIAEKASDPLLENRYKNAVGYSPQREVVLKALAAERRKDGEIFTTNAYKTAIDRGVDNASHYVGQLVTDDYGAEIVKIRERYYRFKDSLFAAYVQVRPYSMKSDNPEI